MPHPTRRTPRPRRAEPLQPDQPSRGDDAEQPARNPDQAEDAREQRREQADNARDNVREGYR